MRIYEPRGKAREYSPLALNFKSGCSHGCKYCYVPRMFKRFNSNYNHFEVKANFNLLELEKSAKKLQGCDTQILLSFTGDPYCGAFPELTTDVLTILNKYNHKVSILTKGGDRTLSDIDLFKKFGNRIIIGATLTFDNNKDSLDWENGAACPQNRIDTLKILHDNGILTWVSFEPVIIPEQSLNLLKQVLFVDYVKVGKLNNYNGIDKDINWNDFLCKAVNICRENNLPFYIKDDLAKFKKITLSKIERDKDYFNL